MRGPERHTHTRTHTGPSAAPPGLLDFTLQPHLLGPCLRFLSNPACRSGSQDWDHERSPYLPLSRLPGKGARALTAQGGRNTARGTQLSCPPRPTARPGLAAPRVPHPSPEHGGTGRGPSPVGGSPLCFLLLGKFCLSSSAPRGRALGHWIPFLPSQVP